MKKIIFFAILFFIFTILFYRSLPREKISSNVYIHDVAVGGMTKDEAIAALSARFQPELEKKIVRYKNNNDVVAEFSFAHFETRFDFSALVDEAIAFSRAKKFRVARIFGREYKISAPPTILYSAEKMEDKMNELSKKIDIAATNASFSEQNGKIIVAKEKSGRAANIEDAAAQTREIFGKMHGDVDLKISEIKPLYTEKNFSFDVKILGAYETSCNVNNAPRRRNISRASQKINNSVVYPGEIFSAGTKIAANLPESGYETATVLVRGKPVEDVGGGVCQVVTTLYNAVLRAELEIIQRHNHSARVAYVGAGFDATVAGDYFDLKFKNSSARPILITSFFDDGKLSVKIHGIETRKNNRVLKFEAEQIETILPEPHREIIDPKIPRGEKIVSLEPQAGYRFELYKYIFVDGKETEKIKINTSVYKPLQGIITIGAG